MPVKRKRGHEWSSVGRKRSIQPVVKHVRVRFVCPSLKEKRIKVKATYEYHPGLRTVLHYPQRVKPCHEPYTCKPRLVRVRSTCTSSSGVKTTLHYPQQFVLKHYVTTLPDEFKQVLPVIHHDESDDEPEVPVGYFVLKEIGPTILL